MTEQATAPQPNLAEMQVPDTYVMDPAKAEHMAYAEKPHREDAAAIGGMITRNEVAIAAEREVTDDPYGDYDSTYTALSDKGIGLSDARTASLDAAKHAGNDAGNKYDQAQELLAGR